MPSQLRGPGSQRSQRTSIDTGTGEQRTPTAAHAAHISRGTFVNKQADLGINTTEAHANQIREEEAEFQGRLAEDKQSISSARSQYDANMQSISDAQSKLDGTKIPGAAKVADQEWAKHRGSLTTVRIVDAENNIVGSYKLPLDYAKQFGGKRGIWATPTDGGKYYNISMKERHHVDNLNSEIAKNAKLYESSYKAQIAKAASPQIKSALGGLKTAQGQINTANETMAGRGASISAAEGRVQGAEEGRAAMWADVRGRQAEKLKTIADIFSRFKVGGKGK